MKSLNSWTFGVGLIFLPRLAAAAETSDSSSLGIPTWLFGAIIGGSVAIGLVIHNARQHRKNQALWTLLAPKLQQGPSTLGELADFAKMTSFMARGKIALCLNEMTMNGRVDVIPAPDGTPQLQKKNFIKYQLRT